MLTSWNIGHLVLLLEVIFCYSLNTVKVFTNSSLAYEFMIKFADPSEFKFVGYTFLAFGAISSIVIAWLADAYTGKFYISLIGVGCLTGSAMFWAMFQWHIEDGVPNYTYMFFANVLIGMYVPTSSVRNVLLLEQFRLPSELYNIRNYIFILVMMRVIMQFICRCIIVFNYMDNKIFRKLCPVVVFFSLFYFLALILIGGKLHLEATYYRIWELALKCFIIALIRKRAHEIKIEKLRNKKLVYMTNALALKERANSKDLDSLGISPEKEELIQKTRRWGFRGILAENLSSSQPIDMEPGKTQKFFDWLFAFVPISVNYADIVPSYPTREELIELHWIYSAVPAVSMYVANQTRRLLPVLFVIIPAFSLGNLMYFLILLSVHQTRFLFKPQTFNYPMIDFATVSVVFDLILFPFFEILVYPRLKRLHLTDLQYLFIGYSVLIIALFHSFGVQLQVESTRGYLPQPNVAQIRMYSFLSSTTDIYLNVVGVQRIGYLDVFTYSMRLTDKSKLSIRIVNDDLGMDKHFAINVVPGETISYVINFQTLSFNADIYDPTVFLANSKRGISTFVIVSPYKYMPFKIFFKNVDDNTTHTFKFRRGVKLEVPPGLYDIFGEEDNGNMTLLKTANLDDSCLYAFLIYNNPREDSHGKFLLLEGPKNISQLRILIHIFLMSLANAIVSVSFFRFLYLESPPKLRGATFTFLYALNIMGFIFLNVIFEQENRLQLSNIIIIYALLQIFMFMLTIYYANQFKYRYPIT